MCLCLRHIMLISQAKILITILFFTDTTFTEPIKINRTLGGKNWTKGVDSFHIPHSVCYQESTGCHRSCNTSYTSDETENYSRCSCSCKCSKENSTVTYIENKWRCLKNQEVREKFGCEINSTLFAGERKIHRIRTLNPSRARKTKLNYNESQCTINSSSSGYIGCHGKEILFPKRKTTEMFHLHWRSKRNASFIQVIKSVEPNLQGRVIRLGITCDPPTPIAEGCLLFKLEGSFTCTEVTSTKAIISSAINPKSASQSTTYSEKATASVTIAPAQATRPISISGGKQTNDDVSSFSQSGIIVGVSVSAALLLFILIPALFICRRRISREDTQTSTSDQSSKDTCTVSRNTKTNSASELEEQDGYEICKDPPLTSIYASRYEVPQQQLFQGPLCNQKAISPEGVSHSDGAYASLNIPEGHHIYGPVNVQDPVYYVLQDPITMSQSYGPGINQPVYYALEDLSVKDLVDSVNNGPADPEPVRNDLEDHEEMLQNYCSGKDQPMYYGLGDLIVKDSEESVNNGPTDPEPVHNVLEDPEVMFQNYGSGIDQPMYYALEDLTVKDSVESDNNGPTDPEPVHNVLEDPDVMFQNYGSDIDQPMYYALEDLTVKDSVESVNNGPTDPEPVHSDLEDPEVMFQNYGSDIDQPMYYALEDLTVKDSVESGNNGHTELQPVYNVLEKPYTESAEEPGCYGPVTEEGPVYNASEEPNHDADYPRKDEPVYNVLEAPGLSGTKTSDGYDPE